MTVNDILRFVSLAQNDEGDVFVFNREGVEPFTYLSPRAKSRGQSVIFLSKIIWGGICRPRVMFYGDYYEKTWF